MSDTGTTRPTNFAGRTRLDGLLFCALIAVCAAVLAGFAWTRPTARPAVIKYQQEGALSYAASTGATSVYGAAGLSTGQPIYVKAVTAVHLTYLYRFSSSATAELRGTQQLFAQLSNQQGLTRTIPLEPPTAFRGAHFTATAVLHIATLTAIADVFNTVTAQGSYTVSIDPHVALHGTLASTPVTAVFEQPVRFGFDSTALSPSSAGATASAGAAAAPGQPMTVSTVGTVQQRSAEPVDLLGNLTVSEWRIMSLAVLALSVAGIALLGRPLLRQVRSTDERIRIAAKFTSTMVEVAALPTSASSVVQLATFDGLVQVGRQLECPLLHLRKAEVDVYAVVDNATVYRYSVPNQPLEHLETVPSPEPNGGRHAAASAGRHGRS